MDTPKSREKGPEEREVSPKDEAGFRVTSATFASPVHPERNEDTVLGDPSWAATDRAKPPHLGTKDIASDAAAIAQAAETIAEHADALRKNRFVAVLDGISGKGGNGTGAIAARIAGAAVSEHLSYVPELTSTDRLKEIAATALYRADDAVRDYEEIAGRDASPERKEEIAVIGTTMDLVLFGEGADGGTDAVIAHCGDSRVYRLVAATGELQLLTIDENRIGLAYAEKKIASWDDYVAYADALSLYDVPMHLRQTGPFKTEQEFLKAGSALMSAIGSGIGDATRRVNVIRVEAGDKIIVCSDGVHDNLSGAALRAIIKDGASAERIAKTAENAYMKPDDVSLVMVEVGDLSEVRRTREKEKKDLSNKIVWAKSAALSLNKAETARIDALLLGARRDEATLLELEIRDALSAVGLSEAQVRVRAREAESKRKGMDEILASSQLPPESKKLADRRAVRDAMAAQAERFSAIVDDFGRLEEMRKEITERTAKLKDADEASIDSARKELEE